MRLKIFAFIAIVAMSVSGHANAGYFSAGKILSLCVSEKGFETAYCNIYLASISDAQDMFVGWGDMPKRFCIPERVNLNQLKEIYIKHANGNPQELHLTAASMVINAFLKAFPCGGE